MGLTTLSGGFSESQHRIDSFIDSKFPSGPDRLSFPGTTTLRRTPTLYQGPVREDFYVTHKEYPPTRTTPRNRLGSTQKRTIGYTVGSDKQEKTPPQKTGTCETDHRTGTL